METTVEVLSHLPPSTVDGSKALHHYGGAFHCLLVGAWDPCNTAARGPVQNEPHTAVLWLILNNMYIMT